MFQLSLRYPPVVLTVEGDPQVLETHLRHLEHAPLGAVALPLLVDHRAQRIRESALFFSHHLLR